MKGRFLWWMVLLFLLAAPLQAEEERRQGYYSIVAQETGRLLCRTGLVVQVGDEYLTADNLRYRVVKIEGDTVYAEFRGREDLSAFAGQEGARAGFFDWLMAFVGKNGKRPVAIYHTHDDESYVPTDGSPSIPGGGGVIRVGESLAARLRREKIPTVHSRAAHDPHDGLAYERSRRTAVDLLRHNPSALLDIHRDAAPRQEYAEEIGGTGVTKIQIVLGRTNPNLRANETFAKQIKAAIDRKYPVLIKVIFYGAGKYNQDLSPRALLLEFGAHTNARQSAERAAAIFGRAAGDLLATPSRAALRGQNTGAWRTILWIVGAVVVGAAIFLLLNAAGLTQAGRNLGRFFRQEFASALGERRRRRRRSRGRPRRRRA
ncbi:MAG: stage II sporulation protein P [Firmicutes bacterium]|nr:stage II sporulation protein P [Bacillota bacterium]